MQRTPREVPPRAPTAVERQRRPAGPVVSGESTGKRTSDERNDPAVEPGAAQGRLHDDRSPHEQDAQ